MDDTISRQAAIEAVQNRHMMLSKEKVLLINDLEKLPSAQPDTYWKEQCQSYEQTINKLRESLSAKSESFEWCTDCKEYDQESHCCHRYSKMIRKTVEEMQIQIVHCIDCRHSEYDSVYSERWCHYNGKAEVVDDYHFCRDGERREDG